VTLHIAIGSTIMTATLKDNPTARDFAALLPLTVMLREFSPSEKVSGALPRYLSEEGAPATDAGTRTRWPVQHCSACLERAL